MSEGFAGGDDIISRGGEGLDHGDAGDYLQRGKTIMTVGHTKQRNESGELDQ